MKKVMARGEEKKEAVVSGWGSRTCELTGVHSRYPAGCFSFCGRAADGLFLSVCTFTEVILTPVVVIISHPLSPPSVRSLLSYLTCPSLLGSFGVFNLINIDAFDRVNLIRAIDLLGIAVYT